MPLNNRLQAMRESKGLSRESLAQMVETTRQTIGLIESGRVNPGTLVALRLAGALETTVEQLFWEDPDELSATPFGNRPDASQRTYLACIRERWIARPVPLEEGLGAGPPAQGIVRNWNAADTRVQLLQPKPQAEQTVFVSGCEPGLGLLAGRLAFRHPALQGVWFNAPNRRGLDELSRGVTHIAAIHGGESDCLPDELDARFGPDALLVLHFVSAQMGWILPPGNPKGFTGAADLSSGRFALINRVPEAGARTLLDQELKHAGVAGASVPGYGRYADGHRDLAETIAKGGADVGIGHAGVAAWLGLAFIPLRQERCLILVPKAYAALAPVRALLDALASDAFRKELAAAGPYDTSRTGQSIETH